MSLFVIDAIKVCIPSIMFDATMVDKIEKSYEAHYLGTALDKRDGFKFHCAKLNSQKE